MHCDPVPGFPCLKWSPIILSGISRYGKSLKVTRVLEKSCNLDLRIVEFPRQWKQNRLKSVLASYVFKLRNVYIKLFFSRVRCLGEGNPTLFLYIVLCMRLYLLFIWLYFIRLCFTVCAQQYYNLCRSETSLKTAKLCYLHILLVCNFFSACD